MRTTLGHVSRYAKPQEDAGRIRYNTKVESIKRTSHGHFEVRATSLSECEGSDDYDDRGAGNHDLDHEHGAHL